MPSALGRRRGTQRGGPSNAGLLVGLVVALIGSALLLGLLLGTHLLWNTPSSPDHPSFLAEHSLLRHPDPQSAQQKPEGVKNLDWGKDDDPNKDDPANHAQKQQGETEGEEEASGEGDDDTNKESEEEESAEETEQHDIVAADQVGRDAQEAPLPQYPYDLLTLVPPNYQFSSWTAPGGSRFAEYTDGGTPYLITDTIRQQSDALARSRRTHIQNAMKFAWNSYSTLAFGKDEVLPQSGGYSNNWGGIGTTLIDSLDTLWLMGLKDEFWKARDWVRDKLSHDIPGTVSVFETTIRSLGGLLSAYDWSGDVAFRDKAKDLGERLFVAFDTPSGIPNGHVGLATGRSNNVGWTGNNAILAELGTLQLEFRYLAKVTEQAKYATTSEKVFSIMNDLAPANGLYPYYVRNSGNLPAFANDKLTFGAMSDSFYEYMLKVWLQGGKTEPMYRDMYDKAMEGMHTQLLQTSTPSKLVYIADKNNGELDHKMDHLVCFMGGLLALGAYTDPQGLQSPRAQRDLRTGKALAYTCYQMYARMNTGISAEYVQFYPNRDFEIGRGAPHYLLRPETVESFFILNQLTGDPIYREWGWEVFSAVERYCKTSLAYGQLRNVQDTEAKPQDKMESFFLAETLKYMYLLQDPDTEVDVLNKHVFNTEAHPTRIFPIMDAVSAKQ